MNILHNLTRIISYISFCCLSVVHAQSTPPINIWISGDISYCDSVRLTELPYSLQAELALDPNQSDSLVELIELKSDTLSLKPELGIDYLADRCQVDIPDEASLISLRLLVEFPPTLGGPNLFYPNNAINNTDSLEVQFFVSLAPCSDVPQEEDPNEVPDDYNDTCLLYFQPLPSENDNFVQFWAYFNGDTLSARDTSVFQRWDFGDSTFSDEPYHSYSQPGFYTVCLTVIDYESCELSYCQDIFVGDDSTIVDPYPPYRDSCTATFQYDPDEDLSITFTPYFEGIAVSPYEDFLEVRWDFGDGTTSSEGYHLYQEEGIYPVCLQIRAGDCEVTYCEDIRVEQHQQPCEIPILINWTELGENTYEFSVITDSTQYDWALDKAHLDIVWMFEADTVVGDFYPIYTFAYGREYYEVWVAVTDTMTGCTSYHSIHIPGNRELPPDTTSIPVCEAEFEYRFLDTQVVDVRAIPFSEQGVLRYQWEFGNGDTASGTSVTYAYDTSGTYEICLKTYTTEYSGCFMCKSIYVWPDSAVEDSTLDDPVIGDSSGVAGIAGVVDMDAADIAELGLYIILLDENMEEVGRVQVQADGSYHIENVPAGDYIIQLVSGVTNEMMDQQPVSVNRTNPEATVINFFDIVGLEDTEINQEFDFNVFPNPVQDIATIEIEVNQSYIARLIVRDMLGRDLIHDMWQLSLGLQQYELVLDQLTAGMYHLIIQMDNKITRKSIQVQ